MQHHDILSILPFSFHQVINVHHIPILISSGPRRRRKRHLCRITFAQLGLSLFLQNMLQRRVELLVVCRLPDILDLGLGRQLDKFGIKD